MARFTINDIVDIGSGGPHIATDWVIALDPDFKYIIDQSLNDRINLKEYNSPLPKLKEHGDGFYHDLKEIWYKVRVCCNEHWSDWFICKKPATQRDQKLVITETDKPDIHTTAAEINMRF